MLWLVMLYNYTTKSRQLQDGWTCCKTGRMYLYYRQQTGSNKLIIYNTILAKHSSIFYIEDVIGYRVVFNS